MNTSIASVLAQVSNDEALAAAAGIMAFLAAFAFVFIAIGLVAAIGMWKTFEKAGQPGWAAIIPIYNLVVMFRLGGQSGWFALAILLNLIPFIGGLAWLGIIIWNHVNISKRFGQGVGFAIGLVLLAPIFWLILGFGSSKYDDQA
jgi:Family of unknown function (DUF5684)